MEEPEKGKEGEEQQAFAAESEGEHVEWPQRWLPEGVEEATQDDEQGVPPQCEMELVEAYIVEHLWKVHLEKRGRITDLDPLELAWLRH